MISFMAIQLLLNLALLMLAMLVLWRVAVHIRDVSFIDAVWAWGMVALAWVSVGQAGGLGNLSATALTLALLTSLWGGRLGTHLFQRWRRLGADPRYERILGGAMERNGWSFGTASLLIVFLLQGPLLWFVSLPAQAGILWGGLSLMAHTMPLTLLSFIGIALALFGIAFETIGDAQLEAFRADPANKGQVMDKGLWRYTRHPNYFGDACAWWGIWLVAASGGGAWGWPVGILTLPAPILLTWMLMKWSGAPILEKSLGKSKPGYADYIRRTSGFIPWPPAKTSDTL
jgi:steroid 5-alpha reductase family enzyme